MIHTYLGESASISPGMAASPSQWDAMNTPRKLLAFATLTIALAGCASSYDERMAYLRKVAARGVDTYKLLYSQDAHIDKARCERAFDGSGAGNDAPTDVNASTASQEWKAQVKEFFVDSCVSGKPKPTPDQMPYPSTTPTSSASASPSTSS